MWGWESVSWYWFFQWIDKFDSMCWSEMFSSIWAFCWVFEWLLKCSLVVLFICLFIFKVHSVRSFLSWNTNFVLKSLVVHFSFYIPHVCVLVLGKCHQNHCCNWELLHLCFGLEEATGIVWFPGRTRGTICQFYHFLDSFTECVVNIKEPVRSLDTAGMINHHVKLNRNCFFSCVICENCARGYVSQSCPLPKFPSAQM